MQHAVSGPFRRRNAVRNSRPDHAGSQDASGKGEAMNPLINVKALWRISVLALLLPISCAFAAQTPDSAAISKLLDHARTHAAQINNEADLMDSYTRSGFSSQMYTHS